MNETYQPFDSDNISSRPINDLFDVLELECSEANLHKCYSTTLCEWSGQLTKQIIADLLVLDYLPVVHGDWHLNRIKALLDNIRLIRAEQRKRVEWEKSQKA